MKRLRLRFGTVLLSLGIASCLLSCSKKDTDIQPNDQLDNLAVPSNEVKLVGGRLVFPNRTSFTQTKATLKNLYNSSEGSQKLNEWEQNLHFTSLRKAALAEESRLEQLDMKGKSAPAHELLTSFGFPITYASIINQAGEYQVGNTIYWFHEGFKYEATSEEELAAIKQNTKSALKKSVAGFRIMHDQKFVPLQSNKSSTSTSQRFTQSGDPYAVDKYTYLFHYENNNANQRRIVYATHVYSELSIQGANVDYFDTEIYLLLKWQFYSFGARKWYPVVGESYKYNVNVDFTGKTKIPQQVNSSLVKTGHFEVNSNPFFVGNRDGMLTISLASDLLASSYDGLFTPRRSIYEVEWDFEITGVITSYTDPSFSSSGYFSVGTPGANTILW